jgi:hypothetical protein
MHVARESSRRGSERTALVTGASSGIGYELARLFARDGFSLILVARNRDALDRIAEGLGAAHGVSSRIIAIDLTEPGAAERIYRAMKVESVHVDVLVNNAGYGAYGRFSRIDLSTEINMIQLNVSVLTALTKLFLPQMLGRKYGRILNVASTAAFQPGPLMAVYYASKAYVLSFSEALYEELRGTGVTVTALCPGPTKTNFQERASLAGSRMSAGGPLGMMDAETVARSGYRALMRGRPIAVPGMTNKMLVQMERLTPRWVVRRTVRAMQASRSPSGI